MKIKNQKKLLWLFDMGYVSVDTLKGLVYRTRNNQAYYEEPQLIRGSRTVGGYKRTCLRLKNDRVYPYLHQIVFLYKYRHIPEGMTIDHKDNDKDNNRLSNLQLLSNADNARKGHVDSPRPQKGEINKMSKLTTKEVIKIRKEALMKSAESLAKEYKVSVSNVYFILNRTTWRHI